MVGIQCVSSDVRHERGGWIMRMLALLVAILAPAALANAAGPAYCDGPGDPAAGSRDAMYCQEPYYGFSASAATSQSTEIADDLPDTLVGREIEAVTFYIAQWFALWQDPVSLVVTFYDAECPPDMVPDLLYEFPWAEMETQFEWQHSSQTAYSAKATLPEVVTIGENMSIGGYLVITWPEQPYTGFVMSNINAPAGCGEAYWDAPLYGAPRWTPISQVVELYGDMAYCLWEATTDVPEEVSEAEVSWGRVKGLYR
jgi:hypothetical protein